MAKNKIQEGDALSIANNGTETIRSGQLVVVGALACVALSDIPVAGVGPAATRGVWRVPKAETAIAQGTRLYQKADGALTATEADAQSASVGVAAADSLGTAAGTVDVLLNI